MTSLIASIITFSLGVGFLYTAFKDDYESDTKGFIKSIGFFLLFVAFTLFLLFIGGLMFTLLCMPIIIFAIAFLKILKPKDGDIDHND